MLTVNVLQEPGGGAVLGFKCWRMQYHKRHRTYSSFSAASMYSVSILAAWDWLSVRAASHRAAEKPTVLFIKMDGIGDEVIWSTTLATLDQLFPGTEYRRVLIGDVRWAELLTETDPFDEKIFIENRRFAANPLYRMRVLRRVAEVGAQIAINFRITRRFFWEDAVVRASGAGDRIGFAGTDNLMSPAQERMSARWYTRLIPEPDASLHELEIHEYFLKQLGAGGGRAHLPAAPLRGDHTIIFLGSADPGKRWPIARLAALATELNAGGHDITFCGGPNEIVAARELLERLHFVPRDLVGKTSLAELKELLSTARLVITNDTGAGHISTLARIPTVVITPGHHVGRFFPYPEQIQRSYGLKQISLTGKVPCLNCGWFCTNPKRVPGEAKPCIDQISVDDALGAIEQLLGGGSAEIRT